MHKKRKFLTGFTLIELMIVVAIIGIIAGIVIPKFADMIKRAKEAATKGSLGALRSTVSIYYASQEGMFPYALTEKITTVPDGYLDDDGGSNIAHPDLVPRYIKSIPKNVIVGHPNKRDRVWNASCNFSWVGGNWTDPPGSDDGGWIYLQHNSGYRPGWVRLACPIPPNNIDSRGIAYSGW